MTRVRTFLIAAMLIVMPSRLYAQNDAAGELTVRPAVLSWDAKFLRMSVSFRDVVTPAVAQKLSSGLPTVIAMRAYVFEANGKNAMALGVKSCRVVYDLWDEVYRVKLGGPGGERDVAIVNVEGVVRQCGEVTDMPLVARSLLQPKSMYFAVVAVDVNPVSPQMVEQMRRWVARPLGSTGLAPSDALFSSFVSMFVRQMGVSDSTLRFRTEATSPP